MVIMISNFTGHTVCNVTMAENIELERVLKEAGVAYL
jgi:hypothetical protein